MDEHSWCSDPKDGADEVVSHHLTPEGVVVYTRCRCGALRIRLHRWNHGGEIVAESRHSGNNAGS